MSRVLPRYPVYIPSKGRHANTITARILDREGTPFRLVVEDHEYDEYVKHWGKDRVLMLPFANRGTVVPARNWIIEHANGLGYERHWQLDDNLRYFGRRWMAKRLHCDSGICLRACEDRTERLFDVAVSGLSYYMFAPDHAPINRTQINTHVYSCMLINNRLPFRFRGIYNEDTDYCLQAIAGGYYTMVTNDFLQQKPRTMTVKGGNMQELYSKQDGRLKMAQELQRRWPGIVDIDRRFGRPQHVINWKRLYRAPNIKPQDMWPPVPDPEYGMQLVAVKDIKSDYVRSLVERWEETHA